MRLQHNIDPPLPGRGGNRKRKRDDTEPSPPIVSATGGFNTFKVESSTPVEFFIEEGDGRRIISPIEHVRVDYFTTEGQQRTPSPGDESWDEVEDALPAHFMHAMDPNTGLIMGRSPEMVRYLVMKAKYRYALEQHEHLIEELRVARHELSREREAKEAMLDEFLRVTFGYVLTPLFTFFSRDSCLIGLFHSTDRKQTHWLFTSHELRMATARDGNLHLLVGMVSQH